MIKSLSGLILSLLRYPGWKNWMMKNMFLAVRCVVALVDGTVQISPQLSLSRVCAKGSCALQSYDQLPSAADTILAAADEMEVRGSLMAFLSLLNKRASDCGLGKLQAHCLLYA